MEIFLDSCDIKKVKHFKSFGLIDGITTNPSIFSKSNKKVTVKSIIKDITKVINGPISCEVISKDYEGMIKEAIKLSSLNKNIVVKIPSTIDGFKALNYLSKKKIKVNFTVLYTVQQAYLAAKLGATYVSPFVGRLDANGGGGHNLIKEIRRVYDNYKCKTKILAASMRNIIYVKNAIINGADTITVTPEILENMMSNELSEISLDKFIEDWKTIPKNLRDI